MIYGQIYGHERFFISGFILLNYTTPNHTTSLRGMLLGVSGLMLLLLNDTTSLRQNLTCLKSEK